MAPPTRGHFLLGQVPRAASEGSRDRRGSPWRTGHRAGPSER